MGNELGVKDRHILLSSMGANGALLTQYFFEAAEGEPSPVQSGFSATALWQLLPEESRPTEIWFLLTPKAEERAWAEIKAEAKKIGVPVHPLLLEGGSAANDTNLFLSKVADDLPPGVKLTLDITQGLRHHAFLFFALALFVSRFRDTELQGVWYSRIETDNRDDPKPIIDLKPVLELAYWFLALSEFQDTGSLRGMSRLIADRQIQRLFSQLSQEFLTGLPVEAGITASAATEVLENREDFSLARIPLEPQVRELILDGIKPLAGTYSEKSKCRLTSDELERQATFIQRYLDTGQDNLAHGFMREWAVSHALAQDGNTDDWLNLKQRSRVEGQYGCLSNLHKQRQDPNRQKLSEGLQEQAKRWDRLSEVRNALQHHGMRPSNVPRKSMNKLRTDWEARESWAGLPVFGGGGGTLLICPLGNTAGVLYSALSHIHPNRCLIVCSSQTETAIPEAIAQANWNGESLTLVMQDVHQGVGEFGGLIHQAKTWLFEADQIEANLTGGTSLMGVLVGQLLEQAGRTYRRPKRRFVLIDRRPYEEQRTEPWVKGDIHYIDGESEQAGGEE